MCAGQNVDSLLSTPTDTYLCLDGECFPIFEQDTIMYVYNGESMLPYGDMIPSIWLDDLPNVQLRVLGGEIVLFRVEERQLQMERTNIFIK
jgi:hypothetical protein